jgi:hypothetical protein
MASMQYDVKSLHAGVSGLMIPYRVRLKGVVMFPFSGATEYTAFVNNVSKAGTYARSTTTATITSANHGLSAGQWVYLDWDLADNPYQVQTVTDANTFTVTVANTGAASGNVTIWYEVLLQADASNQTAYSIVIPGEGILAEQGIRVFLPANIHCTIFYG